MCAWTHCKSRTLAPAVRTNYTANEKQLLLRTTIGETKKLPKSETKENEPSSPAFAMSNNMSNTDIVSRHTELGAGTHYIQ